MNKWKLSKRRKTISTKMIIFIVFILTCLISISYAKYTSVLKINTKVTLKGKPIVQDELPVVISPNTEGSNDYIDFSVSENVLNVQNQYISGNSVVVDFKATTQTGKPRELNLNLDFLNSTEYTYTNGSVAFEMNGNTAFVAVSPSAHVTTTVEPNSSRNIVYRFWRIKI